MTGRLIGVGVGPGDPDLMTLKAARAVAGADVVAYFAKAGSASNARAIAAAHMRPGVTEEALAYPVTTELARDSGAYRAAIAAFYEAGAARLAAHLDAGRDVAVLSEGDPFFYGSYMHLHVRLAARYATEVIPGVTSVAGCTAAAGLPLAQGDDVLAIVPGTLSEPQLVARFMAGEAFAVIKLGRNLAKVRRALAGAGRLAGALYVERGTKADGRVMRLADKAGDAAPYFAVVLVPGWEGRP
jgi:precorrin-2/cobalt-factor-2 C20-methyltransferase